MFKRFARAGWSLAILSIAYSAYALIVVPLIEPPVQAGAATEMPEGAEARVHRRLHQYDGLFNELFPPGSWERKDPKVLESEQSMLLLDEHEQIGENRLELVPCTMILFPKPRERVGSVPRGNPIVLQAVEGAELTFDGPIDLSRGEIGRLLGGRLRGEVIISRRESAPGAGDDIEVVTKEVRLDEQLVQTLHDVRFRFGRSYGSGKDLTISLLPSEDSGSKHGPAVGGVKSLELVHVEKVHLHMKGQGLLPGLEGTQETADGTVTLRPESVPAETAADSATGPSGSPPPPIEITCNGPFFFDAVDYVARFEEQVDVIRLNPEGPSDQLNCELLEIRFSKPAAAVDQPDESVSDSPPPATQPQDSPSETKDSFPKLAPQRIIASGHPVMVRSPSNKAWAQGETLDYNIATRELRLKGRHPVMLRQGPNQVQAPALLYQPLPGTQLGRVWADGPGSFHGNLDEKQGKTLRAAWQKELHLRPHDGQHVLSLYGAASAEFTEAGAITANELHLWLKEVNSPADDAGLASVEPDPTNSDPSARKRTAYPGSANAVPHSVLKPPSGASAGPAGSLLGGADRIVPQKMKAIGNVVIDSPRLKGKTDQLEVWIRDLSAGVGQRAKPDRPAAPKAPARSAAPKAPARSAVPKSTSPPADNDQPELDDDQQFDIRCELLRIEIVRRGKKASIENVTAENDVRLVETRTAVPNELPIEVTGQRVQLQGASLPKKTEVNIQGAPAHVRGRGFSARGAHMRLHRGENRLQIFGPGDMQLPIDDDLEGQTLAQPQMLNVVWQTGMNFDGRTARFGKGVSATTPTQRAVAETMEVMLAKKIDMGQPKNRDKASVGEIRLSGNVQLDNRTIEHGQLLSIDHFEVRKLTVDRISGDIFADGPGFFTTVRYPDVDGTGGLVGLTEGRPSAGPHRPAAEDQLYYLRTDFIRAITGNIHRKQLSFEEQVGVVYGPVNDWHETIDAESQDRLGEDDVLLNCDTLRLAQIGSPREDGQEPVEVTAEGNTVVESQQFLARSHRITYVQAKELLVLEGDGRSDAQLWRQEQIGGERSRAAARKILYWQKTNQVEVDDARYFETRSAGATRR